MKLSFLVCIASTLMATLALAQSATRPAARWSAERANAWSADRPWLCGFNFFPASASNSTEMWQAETFDAAAIEREMAIAESLGLNGARVLLQYLVWEDDAEGLKQRMDEYLAIAAKHGVRTMFIFFDDCHFGSQGPEPRLGKQFEPIIGEYASGFTSSPGQGRVVDPAARPKLKAYVVDLMTRFEDDKRVLVWDLYNEPSNGGMNDKSLSLVNDCFAWAREVDPSQPITMGVWGGSKNVREAMLAQSDVISFHNYGDAAAMEREIAELKKLGRPMICTEWLNRPRGSTVAAVLPVLKRERVGAMHWGLVNGRTQTHLAWGQTSAMPPPKVWQHDLYHRDGTPYDAAELEMFKAVTKDDARLK